MDIIDTNLEQKLYDILTLLQQYREANQYGESLKEYSESLEKQKKLKHIQEECRRPVQDYQIVAIEGNKATITFGD
ncbi:MAG: hypothetical protein WAM27_09535 [Nitrososphaeraceae archaeon]